MALDSTDRPMILVAEEEQPGRERLAQVAAGQLRLDAKLIGPAGEAFALPASLELVLQQAAAVLARGESVTIMPVDQDLTTQEAADFLNMSRQYLVHLLERGDLPFSKVGSHRRVRFGDLVAYKQQRTVRRREVLDELTQIGQEMGGYAPEG